MRAEKLVFSLKRLLGDHEPSTGWHQFGPAWPGQTAGSALPPTYGTAMPMDSSVVYLGETCVFDITLGNQGAAVSALTIKVECSVEGGSTAVLYDNSQNPLQQLAFNAQEHLRVQTDIKEQGLISIVASAVFTDQSGERKYHVQFFKFNSASPVSVRTRVRHLPHIINDSSSKGCGAGKTRCFLEVNVQNSTGLVMQLHAVRLLAAPGVAAEQIAPLSRPQQQQQQQVLTNSHHQQHDHHHQHGDGKGIGQQAQLAPAGAVGSCGSSDTEMLQDIDSFAGGCSSTAAPSVQQKQQQQQLSNHFDQSQQHQQQDRQLQLPGQSTFAPFGTLGQQQQQEQQHIVHLLAGCSHNSLWQIDHQLCGGPAASSNGNTAGSNSSSSGLLPPAAASAGASGVSGPSSNGSSSSSSTLGRLELHWSTCDRRTGRLLTQPLTGPVPASGKEVLMQLHQVMPGAPPSPALLPSRSWTGPQQLAESLSVNKPFTAMFTLTAGPVDTGPLLVLYTTTVPLTTSNSGSTGGLASSSSVQLGTDSSSVQSRRMGSNALHTGPDSNNPEVVVQGSRSRRVPGLAAGQSLDVAFELLPLRCGWMRLPTFVVASETDGRLLDGVHDVHILVV